MRKEGGDQQQDQYQPVCQYLKEAKDCRRKRQEQLREVQQHLFQKIAEQPLVPTQIQQQQPMMMNRQPEQQPKRKQQQMVQPQMPMRLSKDIVQKYTMQQQQQQMMNQLQMQQRRQVLKRLQGQCKEMEQNIKQKGECTEEFTGKRQTRKETKNLSNFQLSQRRLNPEEPGIQSSKSVTDDSGNILMETKSAQSVDDSATKLGAEIDAAIKKVQSMTESANSKEGKDLDTSKDQQDPTGYESDDSEASLVF